MHMQEPESYVSAAPFTSYSSWGKNKQVIGRRDFELTERCNNNCIHCAINLPENDLEAKRNELTTEELKRILKEVADLGALTVLFSGGEPLLRTDFEELYVYTRKLGMGIILFTNANLLTPSLVDLFKKIPPLNFIEVSVYGMHKESYEKVTRTKGSFDTFWKGVNLLLEKNVPFIVKGAMLPQNKSEINEFEAWAATIPWMDHPPAYSMYYDLHHKGQKGKNPSIKKLRLAPEEGVSVVAKDKGKYIKGMKEFCSKFMRPPGNKLFSCGAGHGGGCVDAYGKLQLCMMLRRPDTVYDLKKGDFKDAIKNFFPKIRTMAPKNPEYFKRCAKCFLMGLCEQCPGKAYLENGTFDTPVEYLCDVAHVQAEYLGLIAKGEKAWEVEGWKERINRLVGTKP